MSTVSPLRRFVRATFPLSVRRWVYAARVERWRLSDLAPDLFDRVRIAGAPPLPPADLRSRVSWTTSRKEFVRVGSEGAENVGAAFSRAIRAGEEYRRWLDFGCGCGRLSRYLVEQDERRELTGIDVDEEAVSWAGRHLRGKFFAIADLPPTALPAASFDVAVAVSVFTHFDETRQRAWLAELHRLLRPGGLLIATTLGPGLVHIVPNLTSGQSAELEGRGFLFAPGGGPFNYNGAFHSRAFMEATWQPLFRLREFRPAGMTHFQDLSVWEA